jgi:hypothetical protein
VPDRAGHGQRYLAGPDPPPAALASHGELDSSPKLLVAKWLNSRRKILRVLVPSTFSELNTLQLAIISCKNTGAAETRV